MASERVCFFHRVSCGSMLGKLQTCPFFANPSAARSRDSCVVVASGWCTAGWQHLVAIVPFGSNGFTVTGVAIDECSPCSSDEQMSNQNWLFPACLSFLGFLLRRLECFPWRCQSVSNSPQRSHLYFSTAKQGPASDQVPEATSSTCKSFNARFPFQPPNK